MQSRLLWNGKHMQERIQRLAIQVLEFHAQYPNPVLIGVQPRGTFLAHRIQEALAQLAPELSWDFGLLDITFHRDDFRRRNKPAEPAATQLSVSLENRRVILIDDVLYTGRTIRAALDALQSFGRPSSVQLLVLVDRRLTRELPIQADFVGFKAESQSHQKILVEWEEFHGQDQILVANDNTP